MIVLDASAAVEVLGASGPPGLEQRIGTSVRVHVPELFDVEVMSALRGLERGGRWVGRRLDIALARLETMRATRWGHEELRPGIWARRHRISIYDATYIALARLLDLPLVTTDARLAASAEAERGMAVELYE